MQPRSGEELNELEARQEPRLVKALEMVAPGTALREGIDNIVHARTGGLIVIGDPDELAFLFSGGIKLEIDYSPAVLYQLAKMDGAIALNANATKIPWCNVQLMPDPTILTTETGTRHRTAERVSKQTDALVIAVSQRRDVVSLYVDGAKYILEEIPAVLAKANQALATLDKYRSRLDQVSTRLTALEFEGGVTLHDVLTVLQRAELVTRMAHQDLLDFGRLAELLGYDRKVNTLDYPVSPRGYRILGRIPRLPKLVVQNIVREFRGLDEILAATDPELESVDGVGEIRAKDIREGLRRMKEVTIPDTIDQIEVLELEREVECIDFQIGDHVVYPHHGAGQVMKKEDKEILGEVRQYLTIKILHNDMTVMVPCENAGKAGLRRIIDAETVEKVLGVLSADISEMPKNWNRRFKHNRDKIKTGDIYELAEVVRNLAIREQDKGLSTGEKQMYTRAKKILASELMYALEKTEDEAEAYLDQVLTRENLAAAGGGERLGAARPRAFVAGGARPMAAWSLDAIAAAGIPRAVVAVPPGHGAAAEETLHADLPLGLAFVEGGATRSESVRNALAAAGPDAQAVLVHDAARPMVAPELFTR